MNDGYQDLTTLTRLLKVFLWLGAVLSAISLLSSFMQLDLLGREFSIPEAEANDSREQMIGFLSIGLYVLTVIIFGRWIYKANDNVRALGADWLEYTPGWAVGYFFVPVVNLWKPYQAMRELSEASQNPSGGVEASGILPLWWGLWICSIIVGQVSFRVTMAADNLERLRLATNVQIVSELVHIPLCLVAAALISHVVRAQEASALTT